MPTAPWTRHHVDASWPGGCGPAGSNTAKKYTIAVHISHEERNSSSCRPGLAASAEMKHDSSTANAPSNDSVQLTATSEVASACGTSGRASRSTAVALAPIIASRTACREVFRISLHQNHEG